MSEVAAHGMREREDQGWTPKLAFWMFLLILPAEIGALVFVYPLNALPQIGAEYQTTQVAWLQTAYALSAAVAAALIGKIADRSGKRKVLVGVMVLVTLGLLISAFAPNFGILLFGRVLQGLSLAFPFLTPSLIRDIFPRRTIPLAVALSTAGAGAMTIVSTLLVGTVITELGFRATFWLPAALSVPLIISLVAFVPESPVRAARERLDLVGGALLGAGLAGVLVAISLGPTHGWTDTSTLGFMAAGLVVLALWLVWTKRVDAPLVDLRQLSTLPMTANLIIGGVGVSASVWFYLMMSTISRTAGDGWGLAGTANEASLLACLNSAGTFVSGFIVGWALARRSAPAVAIVVMLSAAVGFGVASVGLNNYGALAVAAVIMGGVGAASYAVVFAMVIATVRPEEQATSSAVMTIGINVFGAVVPVVLYAVMNSMMGPSGYPASALNTSFVLAAGACLATAILAAVLRSRHHASIAVDDLAHDVAGAV